MQPLGNLWLVLVPVVMWEWHMIENKLYSSKKGVNKLSDIDTIENSYTTDKWSKNIDTYNLEYCTLQNWVIS